ncbi:hypothetical protein OL548_24485 [Lysinibacillus sp. MHQ-1]|nr:hypothetical protein OL548_24485 [Lysinibacillus sp. MHQ-1]
MIHLIAALFALTLPMREKIALSKAQSIGKEVFVQLFEVLDDTEIAQYLQIQEKLVQGIQNKNE